MAMSGRARLERQTGRHSLVDNIPFSMPVRSQSTQGIMAGFAIDPDRAARLLPGNELFPFRLWSKALLVVTVVNYIDTVIGKYIEYSIAIACTHGRRAAPRFLPLVMQKAFGMGQYVVDLPVSSEISVKGGKGIWGMPKHQANLRFDVNEKTVSSQYDLDGQFCTKLEVARSEPWLPVKTGAFNYCTFRGMLMKSGVFMNCKVAPTLFKGSAARFIIGDHPRVQKLKELQVSSEPSFTMWFPQATGLLDDYFQCWFITDENAPDPAYPPEGLASIVDLGQGQEWLNQPFAPAPGESAVAQPIPGTYAAGTTGSR